MASTDTSSCAVRGQVWFDQPIEIKITDTTFEPFIGGAGVVYIAGRLAGCQEWPCPAGSACSYANYSLTCTPCEYPYFSADGQQCTTCPAGKGPNT